MSDVIAGRDVSVNVNTATKIPWDDLTVSLNSEHWHVTVDKPVSPDCVVVYEWVDQDTVQASCSCGTVASVKASQSEPAVDIERKIDVAMDHNTKQQESS